MPIYDKYGKIYETFSKPNPLTLNQENISGIILHNFKWKELKLNINITSPNKPAEDITRSDYCSEKTTFVTPAKQEIEENFKIEVLSNVFQDNKGNDLSKVVKQSDDYALIDSEILIIKIISLIETEKKDDLYGEIKKEYKYGSSFVEESYLLNINDFKIQLITKNKIEKNYIIYPLKYKNNEDCIIKNWFKVIKSEPYEDNFLTEALLSDRSPNF